ncbi:hypothetical protein FRB99_000772 [Tulasnella sp. 403]|nr:hypothetical protein FRB99_000772 [Tulasnella sp. 403]
MRFSALLVATVAATALPAFAVTPGPMVNPNGNNQGQVEIDVPPSNGERNVVYDYLRGEHVRTVSRQLWNDALQPRYWATTLQAGVAAFKELDASDSGVSDGSEVIIHLVGAMLERFEANQILPGPDPSREDLESYLDGDAFIAAGQQLPAQEKSALRLNSIAIYDAVNRFEPNGQRE